MSAEDRFAALGLELPPAPKPAGVYKPVVFIGDMAFVSGHGPLKSDGTLITGRVGADLNQQAGYDAARQTGLAILATLRANLGSLNRIKRLVKLLGMVNATPGFHAAPGRDQRLQRTVRQSLWSGTWRGSPQRRGHGLAAEQHRRRDRSHFRVRTEGVSIAGDLPPRT